MAHPFQNFMIRYGAGDRIFAEGDAGTTMYIVQAGTVQLFREIDGEKRPVGTLEKGDFFGEMSILEGLPRTIAAEAIEDAELIEINSTIFDKMIRGNIEIAIRMLRKLSIRLRDVERALSDAGGTARPKGHGAAGGAFKQKQKSPTTGLRLESVDNGTTYALSTGETLIGRYDPVTELKPDIDVTDLDLKRTVSRRHARVLRGGSGYSVIEEVGALNGTFVNGDKLVSGQSHPLVDGDRLSVGTVHLTFRT